MAVFFFLLVACSVDTLAGTPAAILSLGDL